MLTEKLTTKNIPVSESLENTTNPILCVDPDPEAPEGEVITIQDRHTLVIGGPATGKTRCFMKPNILQAARRGDVIVVLEETPLFTLCVDLRENLEQLGYILHPVRVSEDMKNKDIREQVSFSQRFGKHAYFLYPDDYNKACYDKLSAQMLELLRMAAEHADLCADGKSEPRISFFWENFTVSKEIESLPLIMATLRCRNVFLSLSCQSLEYIWRTYPTNWNTIISCCALVCMSLDHFSANYLAECLTVEKRGEDEQSFSKKALFDLLTAKWTPDTCFVKSSNHHGFFGKKFEPNT